MKARFLVISANAMAYYADKKKKNFIHTKAGSDFDQSQTSSKIKVKVILRPTVSRPVCPGVRSPSRPVTNFSFLLEILFSWGFIIFWRPF
jgi:hypothetical protein